MSQLALLGDVVLPGRHPLLRVAVNQVLERACPFALVYSWRFKGTVEMCVHVSKCAY